jgi:hypothetical protein
MKFEDRAFVVGNTSIAWLRATRAIQAAKLPSRYDSGARHLFKNTF